MVTIAMQSNISLLHLSEGMSTCMTKLHDSKFSDEELWSITENVIEKTDEPFQGNTCVNKEAFQIITNNGKKTSFIYINGQH